MNMTKKRVSICGVKMTVEVPEGYKRVLRGPIVNGDFAIYFGKDGELQKGIIKFAEQHPSKVEDGWECVFRKVEPVVAEVEPTLPEPKEETIGLVIILVIF